MAESEVAYGAVAARPTETAIEEINRKIALWRQTPTTGHLGDVLSLLAAPNAVSALAEVAREVLTGTHQATPVQAEILKSLSAGRGSEPLELLGGEEIGVCNPFVQQRVQEVRTLLRINPNNPLALLDLAQLRLANGNELHAEKLIAGARSLSPNDRVILRTQARYLAHVGRGDEAHYLISRHPRTGADPWLMATEIALSQIAESPAKYAKQGLRLTKEKAFPRKHLSELSGALAGLELRSGNIKRARDLFRVALVQPNDNVLAQATTDRKVLSLNMDQQAGIDDVEEASALLAWGRVDSEGAYKSGMVWHAQEPFSSRPLQFLTSLLCADGRYRDAVMLSARGLVADKHDASLLANMAYSLAMLGDLPRAEKVLKAAESLGYRLKPHATATRGLIAMLRGEHDAAVVLYGEAVAAFEKRKDYVLAAICLAYYARAAISFSHPAADKIVAMAVEAHEKYPNPDSAFVLRRTGLDLPENAADIGFRTYQWELDKTKNELIRVSRIVGASEPVLRIIR